MPVLGQEFRTPDLGVYTSNTSLGDFLHECIYSSQTKKLSWILGLQRVTIAMCSHVCVCLETSTLQKLSSACHSCYMGTFICHSSCFQGDELPLSKSPGLSPPRWRKRIVISLGEATEHACLTSSLSLGIVWRKWAFSASSSPNFEGSATHMAKLPDFRCCLALARWLQGHNKLLDLKS